MEGSVSEADIAPMRPGVLPLGRVPPDIHRSYTAGRRLRPDTGLRCKSDGREGRGFVAAICSITGAQGDATIS